MADTIVLVHGRSQQRRIGTELESIWEADLLRGFSAAGVANLPPPERILFPFYGDLYEGYSLSMRQATSVAEKREQVEFEREIARRIEGKYKASGKRLKPRPRTPAAAKWYDPILEILDRVPGFGPGVVRLIMRDVHDYLRNANGLRDRTLERVAAPIASAQGDRLIVIAHSLGTVVTYDLLNSRPQLRVDLWVTMGSPLGIDGAVRGRLLRDANGRHDVPAGVRRWVNFADGDDVVALDERLGDDFKRGGARFVKDVTVKNPTGRGKTPHDSGGYLAQKALARELSAALAA